MNHLSVRRGALALAAAAAFAAVAAPQASAKQLSCGATITKNTKLTKDLVDCPGVGIKIGADGITLDLNGHTVAAGVKRNPKAHGILNIGHDRVTIKGGTVKGFGAYGVRLADAKRNVVRNMHMTGNFTGIGLVESSSNLVEHSDMSGSRFVGVNLTGGAHNRVIANAITASVGLGVLVQTSVNDHGSDNRILDNVIEGNGIQVNPGQLSARIAGNTIRHAGSAGITAFEPSTIIERNSANDGRGQGINAPNGAVDRGANGASGNGMTPQCVGVACAG
jgi:parallel beta helix pectate lyase-like protein